MILGAAAIMTAVMIASVIVGRFVDWNDPARMLPTTSITLAILFSGLGLMAGGRWIYGSWNGRSPIANAIAYGIRTAGLILACVLGLMLVFVFATGMKPEDARVAITLMFGLAASIGLILIGLCLPTGSGRIYLD